MTYTKLHHLLIRLALPVLWKQYTVDVGLDSDDACSLLAGNHGIEDTTVSAPQTFIDAVRTANS